MRNWDQLIDNYIRYCEARGLSESVLWGRRRELERWGAWLKRQRPKIQIESVTAEVIIAYIKSRTSFHAKASVCAVMSHLRNMGEYLVIEGVWSQNPLRWMRNPKLDHRRRVSKRIEKNHLLALLQCVHSVRHEYHRNLFFPILLLLYGTGIRRGELESLNLNDWNPTASTLRIVSPKSNTERLLPVPPSVVPYLEAYLPHRQNKLLSLGIQDESAFFINRDGRRAKGAVISSGIHVLAKKAKIPLITIHQFRHTCASDLLEEGLTLLQVQRVLGHACLTTTVRYTHIADPERKRAVSLHPVNSMLKKITEKGVAHV